MKLGNPSGLQIAFFSFAILLLAVPLNAMLLGLGDFTEPEKGLIRRTLPFLAAIAILGGVPAIREACRAALARPIPADARLEVAAVTLLKLVFAIAVGGAIAAWTFALEGPLGLERFVAGTTHDAEMSRAIDPADMARALLIGALVAPIVEELVFRRFLYRAWERQWGWIPAMIATSALFGLYHAHFLPQFVASILYVCVYRRTGTLWAPILVHALHNLALWYPLLGQYVLPRNLDTPGDLASWRVHLTCLAVVTVAIPVYAFMARHARADAPEPAAPHAALPQ